MSLEQCLRLAKDAGFDGIELNYDLDNDLSPKNGTKHYESIRSLNPRLIYACSRGYGETGPYSSYGSNAGSNNAMTGWTERAKRPRPRASWESRPLLQLLPVPDLDTSSLAVTESSYT